MILELNPLGRSELNNTSMAELGLIPSILFKAADITKEVNDFIPNVEDIYGFSLYEMEGDTTTKGVYKYPEDPDLYALAKYAIPELTITAYQFPYGIMVFEMEDFSIAYRMD